MAHSDKVPFRAGDRVGPYELVSQIGAGGMGVVWQARDTRLGRGVALKFMPPLADEDPQARARFELEARAASALTHPNICVLYDVGEYGRDPYLVMELLDGQTLQERLTAGALPAAEVVKLARDVARGLAAAHGRGILHRDLKPANVFLTAEGQAKILDFGIAKLSEAVSEASGTDLTAAGTMLGTVKYMSPEQALGEAIDGRSDLFSLGALLYEAATGQPPFAGPTVAAVMNAVLHQHPAPLATAAPSLSTELRGVVDKLLAKRSQDRFSSAAHLLEALERETKAVAAAPAATSPAPSIAVLPFNSLGGTESDAVFCDGLAEELIIGLSRLPGLRVAARSSAFQFRGKAVDATAAGRELGVGTVLEGSVRRAGERIRVTAQLVDVASGYQMWSDRFDGTLQDIFDIQERVATAIVDGLQVKLGSTGPRAVMRQHSSRHEAYELYLKGRAFLARRHKGVQQLALDCFQRAVAIDPDYALAWLGVADVYWAMCVYGNVDYRLGAERVERALSRAWEAQPELSEAYATRATLHWMRRRFDLSEADYREAMRRDPNNWFPVGYLGMMLGVRLKRDEAAGLARRAASMEPDNHYALAAAAATFHFLGDWRESIRIADRALSLDPESALALVAKGLSHTEIDEHEPAIEALRTAVDRSNRGTFYVGLLARAYGYAGRRGDAVGLIEELERRRDIEHVADVCLGLALESVDEDRARRMIGADLEAGGWGWSGAFGRRRFADVFAPLGIPGR